MLDPDNQDATDSSTVGPSDRTAQTTEKTCKGKTGHVSLGPPNGAEIPAFLPRSETYFLTPADIFSMLARLILTESFLLGRIHIFQYRPTYFYVGPT